MRKGLENHKTSSIIIWGFLFAMICFDLYNYVTKQIYPDLFAIILYVAMVVIGIFSTVSAVREAKNNNDNTIK